MSQVVQDEGRERLTRIVAGASLAASSVYIVWRWGWTLDRDALWFSLPLVLAETYGVLAAAFLTFTAWTLRDRAALPPLEGRTVDVFVTTADEPIAIIRKTALAAREIRYPHTTWLLDDGHRDEVRAVAEEIGVRYLRRDDRAAGKAGNLNHALAQSTGEFLLQLDADHVALPQIVDRLIGFFADERVAFAQSPQDFYNTDAFSEDASGHGRQLWGDQQLFFNVLQPGKDRMNAAMFVGSCAMLRRAALEDVGGFATHTSVVGTETSLLLHARGWRSAYLRENLAFGLAPATAHAYQRQQLHRAQGAMQALRRYQPLAIAGLGAAQRAQYFDTLTTPLGGLQRLVLYLAPIAFLCTGAFPIHATVGTFAAFFVPAVLLRMASFKLLTRGQGSLLLSDRYWMAKFFTHLIAVRNYFTPRRLQYRDRPDEAGAVPLRTAAPQLALIGLTAASLGWAIYARAIGYDVAVPGWGLFALAGAVALALWHAGLAAHVVQLALAGRHRRAEHRFAESLSVTLRIFREDGKLSSTDIATTDDLTATGLALRSMYPIPEGARVEMTLPLNSGEVKVRGRVVRHSSSVTRLGTVHLAGVEFDATSRATRDAIELHCAQHAMPIEQQRQRQAPIGARALRRLRELRGSRRVDVGMPAHVTSGVGDDAVALGLGLLEDVSERGGRVLLESPVPEGSEITLRIPGSGIPVSGRVVFVHALETSLGMRFVAGFTTAAPATPGEAAARTRLAPWYAALVRVAGRYGRSAVTGSRAATIALLRGSRRAAAVVAPIVVHGSRLAAARAAAAAARVAEGSRVVAARASTRVRAVVGSVAARRAAAEAAVRAPAPDRASPTVAPSAAHDAAEEGIERISLVPVAAPPSLAPPAAPAAPIELGAQELEVERDVELDAARAMLAADAPAMEPAVEIERTPEIVLVPAAAAEPDVAVEAAPEPEPALATVADEAPEDAESPARIDDPERSIEMEIDGEFSFPFELTVGATVLIGESGRVAADIAAVHAIVLGHYAGTLRASRSIRVGPAARIEGTLDAPTLLIDTGAIVNGLAAGTARPPATEAAPPVGDDLPEPGSSIQQGGGAGPAAAAPAGDPRPGARPAPEEILAADDEIFVASPIFTEGVPRG